MEKKYIDSEKLNAEIERRIDLICTTEGVVQRDKLQEYEALRDIGDFITSLQQEQPEVDLDKLVNEEFASHSRTTEYGLEVTYNRAELYQLIKRMALVFNARKEE